MKDVFVALISGTVILGIAFLIFLHCDKPSDPLADRLTAVHESFRGWGETEAKAKIMSEVIRSYQNDTNSVMTTNIIEQIKDKYGFRIKD